MVEAAERRDFLSVSQRFLSLLALQNNYAADVIFRSNVTGVAKCDANVLWVRFFVCCLRYPVDFALKMVLASVPSHGIKHQQQRWSV